MHKCIRDACSTADIFINFQSHSFTFLQNTFAGHLIDKGILCGFLIKATPQRHKKLVRQLVEKNRWENLWKIGGKLVKKSMGKFV